MAMLNNQSVPLASFALVDHNPTMEVNFPPRKVRNVLVAVPLCKTPWKLDWFIRRTLYSSRTSKILPSKHITSIEKDLRNTMISPSKGFPSDFPKIATWPPHHRAPRSSGSPRSPRSPTTCGFSHRQRQANLHRTWDILQLWPYSQL